VKAVWRVARAAVRRRRVQTIVIGVVVGISAGMIVLALGLLESSSAPLDRAHARQSGADLVVAFDRALVPDDRVVQTASAPEVEAAAGPFAEVTLDTSGTEGLRSLATVGRADPAGAVDRLEVWQGRWAVAPGEIVLNAVPGSDNAVNPGTRIALPGGTTLTVVGSAYSSSATADAWVTPAQLMALRPAGTQMLYRLRHAETAEEVGAGQTAVTAGLPPQAVLGSQSYLTVRQKIEAGTGIYIPFLVVFGSLGLIVSILIVANVVSGAVVSGWRNLGVLKAIGFTPNQVMAVYLMMVAVPSVVGCVAGTVLGNLAARPLLADAFQAIGTSGTGIDLWVDAAAPLGTVAVVVLAALVSALRARRLPVAEVISAGSAPRTGRALTIQRWLSGSRMPRSVSLGLGVPFARPARSALTLAAIVLGVTTLTLAIGVTMSALAYNNAMRPSYPDRIEVLAGSLTGAARGGPDAVSAPKLSDAEDEALLRSLSGTSRVAAVSEQDVHLGGGQSAAIRFYRGDPGLGPEVLKGQWPDGAGQVAVPSRFLNQRGLALGDTITVDLDGRRTPVRIVGLVLSNNADIIFADWKTLTPLKASPRVRTYEVHLKPGTDRQNYLDAIKAGDPGLTVLPPRGTSEQAVGFIGSATLLTLVLGVVAALGVVNTVALNARERRRDLGMLKSIGMTPRQVTVMMVSSMGALGVVGGLIGVPLGVAAHHAVFPAMMRAAQSDVLGFVLDVYRPPMLALLAMAGIVIAVLGAFLPARSAARAPIAAVLHNE
jgi:putative ABC transport system permease protein